MHSANTIPSIAATQARAEHERREHKWRIAAHTGLSHKQENEQQHAQLTQWRHTSQHQQGHIKVYAPDFIAQLQKEADEQQAQSTQAAFDALSPASKSRVLRGQLSPGAGRVVKKFGHARTASMVDLLFKEAQAEAAGHKEKLKENVQRNERRATELIRRDYDKLQQNNAGFVAEIRDYLALADEQKQHEREAFYQRWCSEVFDPIQRQVAAHIAKHDKQLSAFRRALFAYYLASPTSSLAFPLTCTTSAAPPPQPSAPHLTHYHYNTHAIDRADPTLHTLTRQQQEAALPSRPTQPPLSHTERVVFDACMWDKLAATPYGRYVGSEAELGEVERGRVEAGVRQRMAELGWDEYNVLNDSKAAYMQWFGDKSGVRIVEKNKNRPFNIVSNQSTA